MSVHENFINTIKKNKLMLPPLSGYTDFPFRQILSKFSPPSTLTEMVNARAIIEKNKKTEQMLQSENGSHLKGSQLVGNNPDEMKQAAEILEKKGFDFIDINMGCTVKKVVKKGQGVALMKNEQLAQRIAEQIINAVSIPVTVKLRTGFSESSRNITTLAKKFEEIGITALTIHGRNGEKKFGPFIDYDLIAQVKKTVSIPIVANGGITEENAKSILQQTNADAVMPGRSLISNPWIIPNLYYGIQQKKFHTPLLEERKHISKQHVQYQCQFYGEKSGIIRSRKIIPKYFPKMKNGSQFKADILQVFSYQHMITLIERIHEDQKTMIYG